MSMYPIASHTMSNSTTTVHQFRNIPDIYDHLELRIYGRFVVPSTSWRDGFIYFNDDFATVYNTVYLSGDGNSASSAAFTGQIGSPVIVGPGDSIQSGRFGISIVQIFDYKSNSKFKTIKSITGADGNGSGYLQMRANVFQRTNPISVIEVSTGNASVYWTQGSRFDLYGIMGEAK